MKNVEIMYTHFDKELELRIDFVESLISGWTRQINEEMIKLEVKGTDNSEKTSMAWNFLTAHRQCIEDIFNCGEHDENPSAALVFFLNLLVKNTTKGKAVVKWKESDG